MIRAEETLARAVRLAADILAGYLEPGPRDCNETINRLLLAVDNEAMAEALREVEDKRNGRRLNKTAPQDSTRISTTEGWKVRYWTKELGVTEERLKELIRRHGNSAEKIRQAVGKAQL
jgi:hypothetical protein